MHMDTHILTNMCKTPQQEEILSRSTYDIITHHILHYMYSTLSVGALREDARENWPHTLYSTSFYGCGFIPT